MNRKNLIANHFTKREVLKSYIKNLNFNDSVILVKGSRGMRMEEFVSEIKNKIYELMLYYLFEYINKIYSPPGFDIFRFLTFRSALAAITGLFLAFYLGPKIIRGLQKYQIGEAKKVDAPQTHWSKAGTPTMGGLIIIFSAVVPVLLWGDLTSIYIILILGGTVWLSLVGFLDDYLKVVKKLPKGLIGKYKLLGQFLIGLVVGFGDLFLTRIC